MKFSNCCVLHLQNLRSLPRGFAYLYEQFSLHEQVNAGSTDLQFFVSANLFFQQSKGKCWVGLVPAELQRREVETGVELNLYGACRRLFSCQYLRFISKVPSWWTNLEDIFFLGPLNSEPTERFRAEIWQVCSKGWVNLSQPVCLRRQDFSLNEFIIAWIWLQELEQGDP